MSLRAAAFLLAVTLGAGTPAAARARGETRTFRHARFSIGLPGGWRVSDWKPGPTGKRFVPAKRPGAAASARVVHLADGRGNYLSVHVDQALDVETDAVWTVRAAADGESLEIGREGAMCGGAATAASSPGGAAAPPVSHGPCSAGNRTLELATLPAVKLRGHTYAFEFGNTGRELGVPLETFRWMLQTFRAR